MSQIPPSVPDPDGRLATDGSGRLLAKNSLLNFLGQALPLLAAVFAIPYVLHGLGPERFGILSLAWALIGYMSVFDLGIGRAMVKFLSEALGANDRRAVPQIFWTAIGMQTAIALFGGGLLALLAPFLAEYLLKLSDNLRAEAALSFYIMAAYPPAVLATLALRGALEAAQRFDLVNLVKVPASISVFAVPAIGLYFDMSLPGMLEGIFAVRIGFLLIYLVFVLRVLPGLAGRPRMDAGVLRRMLAYGGWLFVSNIMGMVFNYTDRFFIGSLLSVAAVAFYTAPYEIVSSVTIVPMSITLALFPALSAVSGHANGTANERAAAMYRDSLKYLLLFITPLTLILWAFAGDILTIWLGPEYAEKSLAAFLILNLAFYCNTIAHIPLTVVQALNRPDLKAKLDLALLPVYLGLFFVLIPLAGLAGAAWVKCVISTLDMIALFLLARIASGVGPGALAFKGMKRAGGLTLAAVLGIGLVKGLGLGGLPGALVAGAVIAAYLGAAFLLVLDGRERADMKNMLLFRLGGSK